MNWKDERATRFDQTARSVRTNGGLWEATVGQLRDVYGAGRVGHVVRAEITQALRERAVEHWPQQLPDDQDHLVLLYATDASAGQAFRAAVRLAHLESKELDS